MTQNKENLAKLLKKIVALRAKAQSTTNENEAEIFMNKVNELMTAHGLFDTDLLLATDENNVKLTVMDKGLYPWRIAVMTAMADLYDCVPLVKYEDGRTKKKILSAMIAGRETKAHIAVEMTQYVIKEVLRRAAQAEKAGMSKGDYASACGQRMMHRINKMKQELNGKKTVDTHNAVATLSETDLVRNWLNNPGSMKNRSEKQRDELARYHGDKDASKISLNTQVGAAKTNRPLMIGGR